MTTRIVLADDQPLLLSALQTIIDAQEDFCVVAATCSDGVQAVATLRSDPTIDIVIMDIRMPVMDGIEALTQIRQVAPEARVIMLTTFNVGDYVDRALFAGAHGFLLKDAEPDELIRAIRTVARGESILSAGVTDHVLDMWRSQLNGLSPAIPAEQKQGLSLLTPREREVFQLVARGMNNSEIDSALVVSETTIKSHVSSLLAKLHCRDRVGLVVLAGRM
ncbi:response regulator [Corynebacterium silvaticum]|uniref:Response regulator transcription factor n=1 Tax=Corynebacterium silvaticum TaxID=2320431 RepID=A0A7Y4LKP9_9CORY|nr:response regulator transcription factor [Corynebacterium silvaticum]ARU45216.1 response regulator transcription factor [Corynebacterium silvaticum]MBH5301047.1 response regulator transcription factor [Corynebacterium silvaticum]NOM65248.1 response regulator transcription factor [Corynebacterium silvaticum]NON70883.1 response regulator transcription factor [Corynebacterium silvaticum]TFA92741.1 response regulator transcription factor [Corynebacterium silvaticum]